jgi:MFS family permease
MPTSNKLTREQKESMFLLQIGTFLEYFDLMLYVHMAVVLNELFFPPTDPKTASIIAAFAFCSTYLLRPLGALIFGWIGDNIGRKSTIIITTMLMSISCVAMANLPTYAEIGITAAVIVSTLRIVQGMTSMGEVMGAKIYMTEITKPPKQFIAVASIEVAAAIGSMTALGIATITTSLGFNWRYAFWAGAFIAVVGSIARTKLRETPDFADAKRKRQKAIEQAQKLGLKKGAEMLLILNTKSEEKFSIKSFYYFLVMQASWPFCFYMAYIYFIPMLKTSFGYSSADVILHNLYISFWQIGGVIIYTLLSSKVYPLWLSKYSSIIFVSASLISPFLINYYPSVGSVFFVQVMFVISLKRSPSDAILIKHFPIFKRFTLATFGYALSRAVMYVLISFGLVYLTEWFSYYGIWVIACPTVFFWLKAIKHYENLEKEAGSYPIKGEWQVRANEEYFND